MRPPETYLEQHSTELLGLAQHADMTLQMSPDLSSVVQPTSEPRHVTVFDGKPYIETTQTTDDENNLSPEEKTIVDITNSRNAALLSESGMYISALLGKIGAHTGERLEDSFSATYSKGTALKRTFGTVKISTTSLADAETPTLASGYAITNTSEYVKDSLTLFIHRGRIADVHFETSPHDAEAEQLTRVCTQIFSDRQRRVVLDLIHGRHQDDTILEQYMRELNRSHPRQPEYDGYASQILPILRSRAVSARKATRDALELRSMIDPSFSLPTSDEIRALRTAMG